MDAEAAWEKIQQSWNSQRNRGIRKFGHAMVEHGGQRTYHGPGQLDFNRLSIVSLFDFSQDACQPTITSDLPEPLVLLGRAGPSRIGWSLGGRRQRYDGQGKPNSPSRRSRRARLNSGVRNRSGKRTFYCGLGT